MTASSDLDAALEATRAEFLAKYVEGGADDAAHKHTDTAPSAESVDEGEPGQPITPALTPDGMPISAEQARNNLWLAHRWPEHYGDRCAHVGGRWICRRCSILYPIGTLVAILFAAGFEIWPRSWDMEAIYILCVPGTVAYCGEAVGLFRYRPRWQGVAMAITAVGFGRGLGYEFLNRWSGEFWWPVTIFGGLWFAASLIAAYRNRPERA